MEHQYRRGIYRPNAQRLSLTLAPLVTQRSMMFRVKTDLAMKGGYAEFTSAMEYSPALCTLSASAQIVTAVLTAISVVMSTAMSSASVYSQDSWKSSNESPCVSAIKVDPRRMAMAFSPSVQWSDMAPGTRFAVESPLARPTFIPQPDILFSEVMEDSDTKVHSEHNVVPVLATNAALDVGSAGPVGRRLMKVKPKGKKIAGQVPERSKSSKAFQKVMARLSFQPSKRELAQSRRADAVAMSNNLPSMDFKLPEFRVSPIRYSFIAQTYTNPSLPRMLSNSSSMTPLDRLVEEGVRQRHATMPPPATPSERKGHRHVQSSVAAPYSCRWDKGNMPPMPVRPVDNSYL